MVSQIKIRRTVTVIFLITILLLLNISCSTTEPEGSQIQLKLEDASCTEVWLKLTIEGVSFPAKVGILINGISSESYDIKTTDTLIYLHSFEPNTEYTFAASINGTKSNVVTTRTMDTTSSNFTWETFYFGNIGSSYLQDVWIFDEDNIWAVGEITIIDSTGQASDPYSLVKWNGNNWSIHQVKYGHFPNTNKRPGILKAIFALDEENIFVSSESLLLKLENGQWVEIAQFAESIPFYGQVNALWGSTSDKLYCVGNNGAIYHYFGTGWKKIASGTNLNIQEIWGDYNEQTGKWKLQQHFNGKPQRHSNST